MQITTELHTFSLHTALENIVFDIDPRRIEQVLGNLISNAIKYSPMGGSIEIAIKEEDDKEAVLSICDHGIGIPSKQQALVFGRFVRADNARVRGIGGTGLGLYLSREFIERHGGRIWFESTEDQGTTFYFSLPIKQD